MYEMNVFGIDDLTDNEMDTKRTRYLSYSYFIGYQRLAIS